MIIAVDIGNSAVKATLAESASLSDVIRLDSATASEADLRAALEGLAAEATGGEAGGEAGGAPPPALAVSVVDRWSDRLARACEALGLELSVVPASGVPMRVALVRPDQTGPDRLLGAWAAWRLHGAPLVLVSLGTATTVDAVDADGFFLGGAIMPGPGLAAEALAQGTARLPHAELALPIDVIGRDTLSALRSGIIFGQVGAIRELVARMRLRLGPAASAVVSGGHARSEWARIALLEPADLALPAVADVMDPDLVLRGLGLLAEHRQAQPAGGLPAGGVRR